MISALTASGPCLVNNYSLYLIAPGDHLIDKGMKKNLHLIFLHKLIQENFQILTVESHFIFFTDIVIPIYFIAFLFNFFIQPF